MLFRFSLLFAALVAQPLVDEDVLEPSVANEVAHALARAPQDVAMPREDATPQGESSARGTFMPKGETTSLSHAEKLYLYTYATNGLSATDRAIRLVSSQQADGRWRVGTNDVTRAARLLLQRLTPTP